MRRLPWLLVVVLVAMDEVVTQAGGPLVGQKIDRVYPASPGLPCRYLRPRLTSISTVPRLDLR